MTVSVYYPTIDAKNEYPKADWMPKSYLRDLYKIGRNSFG